MWEAHEGMGWWMLFGGVFWVLFIGTLVYMFTSAFVQREGSSQGTPQDALEIARRRLAAGEISNEDYDRIREALRR